MEPVLWDTPLSGAEQLAAVLEHSGVDYRRDGNEFRFVFSSRGCRWQMIGRGEGERVLFYAVHPTPVTDRQSALELCSDINGKAAEGSCFLREERIVFRTQAKLIEACAAREMVLQALEYSASVMTFFWGDMARGANGLSLQQSMDAIHSRFGDI